MVNAEGYRELFGTKNRLAQTVLPLLTGPRKDRPGTTREGKGKFEVARTLR